MPTTVNKTLKRRKWTGMIEKEKKTRRREAKVADAMNLLTLDVLFAVVYNGKYADFKKAIRKLLKGQRVKLTDAAIRELYKKMKHQQGVTLYDSDSTIQEHHPKMKHQQGVTLYDSDSADPVHHPKMKHPTAKPTDQAGGLVPEGPYLQRLTTKGDDPITGNDMSKALEEIITVLNDAQYLQEDGGGITMPINAVLNYFNGNKEPLEYYLRYYKGPQFYSFFPPSINLDSILVRMDNIIDFLNIYKSDKNIKLRFAVEHGLKPESVLKETPFQKMVSQFDMLDQNYNRFNQYRRLQFY